VKEPPVLGRKSIPGQGRGFGPFWGTKKTNAAKEPCHRRRSVENRAVLLAGERGRRVFKIKGGKKGG